MNVNKVVYTWDDFKKDADRLAARLKNQGFEALLIITKGGLPLGSYLAQKLGIEVIETISIQSYKKMKRHSLNVIKPATHNLPARLLIVDDICDSGQTLRYVEALYNAPTVTLFKRSSSKFEPTFFEREIKGKAWIVFPWESEVTTK